MNKQDYKQLHKAVCTIAEWDQAYGQSFGWREAADFVLSRAVDLFEEGRDIEAILVRNIAKDLQSSAEDGMDRQRTIVGLRDDAWIAIGAHDPDADQKGT